jgi:hypothetical protein
LQSFLLLLKGRDEATMLLNLLFKLLSLLITVVELALKFKLHRLEILKLVFDSVELQISLLEFSQSL